MFKNVLQTLAQKQDMWFKESRQDLIGGNGMSELQSHSGRITEIQRCSLHDGAGIRTTIFFKGCNFRCAWCHNPETVSYEKEVLLNPANCIGCGCCQEGCFTGARLACGRDCTVAELLTEIDMDAPYYGNDGGTTLSGGEVLLQSVFAEALLTACRNRGYSTAIESNLAVPWPTLEPVAEQCDCIMADLKLWTPQAHRHWTGRGNESVLHNMRELSRRGIPLVVRTPFIPGVNDTADELGGILRFVETLTSLECYEILPYNPLGESKVVENGFVPQSFEVPDAEAIERLLGTCSPTVPIRIAGMRKP